MAIEWTKEGITKLIGDPNYMCWIVLFNTIFGDYNFLFEILVLHAILEYQILLFSCLSVELRTEIFEALFLNFEDFHF